MPGTDPPDPSLFDNTPGLVRNDHPDTSHQAARKAQTGRCRLAVYTFIATQGEKGATDEDIYRALSDYDPNSLRPRRVELVGAGAVIDSGRKRPTRSGRDATVWTLPGETDERTDRDPPHHS